MFQIATCLLLVTLYSFQPESSRKESVSSHSLHRSHAGSILAFFVLLVIVMANLTTACFISETKSQICEFNSNWMIAFIAISCVFTATYFLIKTGIERIKDLSPLTELNGTDYLLIGATIFHCWSFFGTSFIEEEHMTWYFFWNTLMFFVLVRTVVVLLMYLSKRWSGATEVQEKPELAQKMSAVGVGILPKWVLLIALHR